MAREAQILSREMAHAYLSGTTIANRPNEQESDRPPNKPPIQPSMPKNYDLIMQNKANFRKALMNVNSFITKDYRKNDAFAIQKNKPNSNPNKANFKGKKCCWV
jgi:hypothetical protein